LKLNPTAGGGRDVSRPAAQRRAGHPASRFCGDDGVRPWRGAIVRAQGNLAPSHHRWIWVLLLATIAISSFWIHSIRMFGPFSLIHLLSIFTLVMLPLAVLAARRHNVASHRRKMIGIFFGGLVIAGLFTFVPGRIMHTVLFGE
jgi:uncharacterized membrane protein